MPAWKMIDIHGHLYCQVLMCNQLPLLVDQMPFEHQRYHNSLSCDWETLSNHRIQHVRCIWFARTLLKPEILTPVQSADKQTWPRQLGMTSQNT